VLVASLANETIIEMAGDGMVVGGMVETGGTTSRKVGILSLVNNKQALL